MKRIILLLVAMLPVCSLLCHADNDESADTTTTVMGIKVNQRSQSWDDYNPERGFFQKAYSDKGDPRFMIANEDDSFEFGIGGVLRMTAYGDFIGSTYNTRFSTWDIPVPTDHAKNIGISAAASKLFVKSRAKIGKNMLVAFIEINSNEENDIRLGQAYVSYGGFSVGRTHSFFVDLAAGVQTVDLRGPNTSIDMGHALLGYTWNINNNWALAAAMESPDYETHEYTNLGIYEENQNMPDFAARLIYRNTFGHLQLSGLLRSLGYWSFDVPVTQVIINTSNDFGSEKHVTGWGAAFSGKVNLSRNCFFTFQSLYGKGIQQYIHDYANAGMDLVPTRVNTGTENEYYKMRALPTWGGYAGLQYKWNKKLTTSALFGVAGMDLHAVEKLTWEKNSYEEYVQDCKYYDYKRTSYLAVSAFYNINNFCTIGAEYLNGIRWQRERDYDTMTLTGKTDHGVANRFNMMFSYSF